MARRNPQTLSGRISGATGAYMGNKNRHQIVPGNKLGTHNKVYRQIRGSMGLSTG